jgi:hypothetical protein
MTHNFATSTATKKRFMIDVVALHVIYYYYYVLLLCLLLWCAWVWMDDSVRGQGDLTMINRQTVLTIPISSPVDGFLQ